MAAGKQSPITNHPSPYQCSVEVTCYRDRTDPVGYKLSVIAFNETTGDPLAAPDSRTSTIDILANVDNSRCPRNCFRPTSIAFDRQGRLFMSSDSTGEIYVVMKENATSRISPSTGISPPSTTSSPSMAGMGYSPKLALLAGSLLCAFISAVSL